MVSASERRREFVTGFTGSAGIAVVTDRSAALWTDGRYYLQADQQLDCQWMVMKAGQDNVNKDSLKAIPMRRTFLYKIMSEQVPTISEWLRTVLKPGDRVGADPKLVSADQWIEWRSELGKNYTSPSSCLECC